MKLQDAMDSPGPLRCVQCDQPVTTGRVLVDPSRLWFVLHETCSMEFCPDRLATLHQDVIQLFVRARGAEFSMEYLNAWANLRKELNDELLDLIERVQVVQGALDFVAEELRTSMPRTTD